MSGDKPPPACPGGLHFFLGGRDLEMLAIRALLERHAPGCFTDKRLAWGAKVSDYRDEIPAVLGEGGTPVLIELTDDLPLEAFERRRCLIADHHGPLAGQDRPTAIEQVFALLGRPAAEWTRELALVAANDRGHIPAMKALGATDAEIAAIRARDRAAQGLGAADEAEARRAIAARQVVGRLTLAETSGQSSTAIADLLEPALGGPGYDALLVVMPAELAFFGDGETVSWLAGKLAGSWSGGDLPVRGFWGAALPPGPARDRLIAQLIARLAA